VNAPAPTDRIAAPDPPGTAKAESANPDTKAFHLDPSVSKIESIVHHFNQREFKAGVAELKALEDADNHGRGDAWNRHIAVINGSVNLKSLGIADADQLLGVSKNGNLITTNKDDTRQQFRLPADLSVKLDSSIMPKDLDQIANTKTYQERVAKAGDMAAHPEPPGDSAKEVQQIISNFNSGNLRDGAAALRKLQGEDSKKEPEMWLRHIAAVNANIDFHKMGINNASQILSVDEKGRLITASPDLKTEQTRSLDAPNSVQAEKALATSSFIGITYSGDSKLYGQAQEVATLQHEAQEAREPLTPGNHRLSITSDGEQREVDVYVPKGYDASKPTRAFYVLHNALIGGDVAHGEMENETHLNEKADQQNFIVVYPMAEAHENDANKLDGIGFTYHSWNSPGAGMNVTYGNYDDVNYIKAATKLVDSKLNVGDRYLLGFSEGGEFAPQVAAKMPGYWSGIGVWHPTNLGTEAVPHNDALAFEQITGEKDGMLARMGGTTDMLWGMFGKLYPRLATSEPTRTFDVMAQAEGCTGDPSVDKSIPTRVTTTFSPQQCALGRPVVDVDQLQGEHAVDGDTGNFVTRVMGWFTGSKDRTWDSTQYFVDTLSQYHKNP
jgi:poly(3-hydroxybutyrate) depolymerase